eukprot:1161726-Pelagomonas_calceolata.AAC.6
MGKQEVDLRECVGPSLVKKTPDLQMVPVETSKALSDKYVGIYFSAHWLALLLSTEKPILV